LVATQKWRWLDRLGGGSVGHFRRVSRALKKGPFGRGPLLGERAPVESPHPWGEAGEGDKWRPVPSK